MDLSPLYLQPVRPAVPFLALQTAWLAAELAPGACRAAVERVLAAQPDLAPYLAPDEIAHGGLVATDARLRHPAFGGAGRWELRDADPAAAGAPRLRAEVAVDDLAGLAQLLRDARAAADLAALGAAWGDAVAPEVLACLARPAAPAAPHGRWPAAVRPGIYRREHASLVLRSATTTLVLDPQYLSYGWTSAFARCPAEAAGAPPVDGVLLTHTHVDHWHLPSTLHCAGAAATPVVAPRVTPSLLAQADIAAELAWADQTVWTPAWDTTVALGDFTIDVLPFYGEQPTRTAAGPRAGLRNWGNCYRVACPQFSALVLVDAGVDPAGSMLDVAARSRAARGPVDVVLAVTYAFPEVFNPGLAHYTFALPFDALRAAYAAHARRGLASVTLGPEGLARLCARAAARYFLPYAQGFDGLGRPLAAPDGASEAAALARVAAACARHHPATQVLAWTPGAVARFEAGALVLAPGAPP